ncbi:hypothetical protein PENSPDRAFT_671791 [Peniophora sp. CONT]|nr:hypothetical protein PENSPDRAFT_671791 [Peniophora sp. CONT]
MYPLIGIEYQRRGNPIVHFLVCRPDNEVTLNRPFRALSLTHTTRQFELYNLNSSSDREKACSIYSPSTIVAYINSARKNRIACPTRCWCDARLPSPPYYLQPPTATEISDIEYTLKRLIRVDTYVRERFGRGLQGDVEAAVEDESDSDSDTDYSDMPALEPAEPL